MNAQTSTMSKPDIEARRPISHSSPVTVGLVIVILGGVIANMTYMHNLETIMSEKYMTKELFEARMGSLERQIADLKAEVHRQGGK